MKAQKFSKAVFRINKDGESKIFLKTLQRQPDSIFIFAIAIIELDLIKSAKKIGSKQNWEFMQYKKNLN